MAKTKQRDRRNEALQSGHGADVAYGQDARLFGEGGQVTQRALEPGQDDRQERETGRDESLPKGEHPSGSRR